MADSAWHGIFTSGRYGIPTAGGFFPGGSERQVFEADVEAKAACRAAVKSISEVRLLSKGIQ
jgi:hypothetical protein